MIRRPPRSTLDRSSAASDVYKRQPLHPHHISVEDAWGFTFYDRQGCADKIAAAANDGIFTPPVLNRPTIEYPGVAGGQNWGGLAYGLSLLNISEPPGPD